MLHKRDGEKRPSKTVLETEAEAVSFVVRQAIGLDANGAAADYIQLYDGSKDTLAASLDRIQHAATAIIEAITVTDDTNAQAACPRPPSARRRRFSCAASHGQGIVRAPLSLRATRPTEEASELLALPAGGQQDPICGVYVALQHPASYLFRVTSYRRPSKMFQTAHFRRTAGIALVPLLFIAFGCATTPKEKPLVCGGF